MSGINRRATTTVVYLGPSAATGLQSALARCASKEGHTEVRCFAEATAALDYLKAHWVHLLVIDLSVGGAPSERESMRQAARDLLYGLFGEEAPYVTLPRAHVLGLVAGDAAGCRDAYLFGEYHVGAALVAPSDEELCAEIARRTAQGAVGKVALCLAGGGIEGLLYQLGVLRALDSVFASFSMTDVDLVCGISAGACLGALLANGVAPGEISEGLAGRASRVDPLRRSDLFDLNVGEMVTRFGDLGRGALRGEFWPWSGVPPWAALTPTGLFGGERLRAYLARQLAKPGFNDDFRALRRPLYIGATDLDTSEAVVFGRPPLDEVPIHRAVRASTALIPFYGAEQIDGKYYIDGAFTRTTNMRVAVERGASFVILIDPLVPTVADRSGLIFHQGGVGSAMQGLKALVNGRFDKAVRALRDMFPDVSFLLFQPEGEDTRRMAGSPIRYFYRKNIEAMAYDTARRYLQGHREELQPTFARHGIALR